jgi:hypothetical protein
MHEKHIGTIVELAIGDGKKSSPLVVSNGNITLAFKIADV